MLEIWVGLANPTTNAIIGAVQGQGGILSTPNFGFPATLEPKLVQSGVLAERYFRGDPSTCLYKLRQFAELLAKLVAARHSLYEGERETFRRRKSG